MLQFCSLRQDGSNHAATATRSAGSSSYGNWEAAISLLEKDCTSMAMATAAQPSGDACGRQRRYPSTQKASFINQIVIACLLQGNSRKSATSYARNSTHMLPSGLHSPFICKIFSMPKHPSFRHLTGYREKLNSRINPVHPMLRKPNYLDGIWQRGQLT